MKIIFIDTTHAILKAQLQRFNHTCDMAHKNNKAEIESIIHQYDVIIIRNKFKLDKEFINKATNLKFSLAVTGEVGDSLRYLSLNPLGTFRYLGGDGQTRGLRHPP